MNSLDPADLDELRAYANRGPALSRKTAARLADHLDRLGKRMTVQEILARQDELADRFESDTFGLSSVLSEAPRTPSDGLDGSAGRAIAGKPPEATQRVVSFSTDDDPAELHPVRLVPAPEEFEPW